MDASILAWCLAMQFLPMLLHAAYPMVAPAVWPEEFNHTQHLQSSTKGTMMPSEERFKVQEEGCLGYNYKHPHPCIPGVDCAFVVRWQPLDRAKGEGGGDEEDRWVEFHVMADLAVLGSHTSSIWVALGFSSNSDMGDTDVIACLYHAEGWYDIKDGYNTPGNYKFVLDNDNWDNEDSFSNSEGHLALVQNGTEVNDGSFSCKFLRQVSTGDTLQDKLLDQPQHVLVALGSLQELSGDNEGSKMLVHAAQAATMCTCDVMACDKVCSCSGGFFYQMLKLHGVLMSLCFMFLVPLGAIFSRYYKDVFANNLWFKAHVTLMVLGVVWSVVGLALVLLHTRGVFSVGVHQVLGIIVLCLGVLQVLVGFLRPYKYNKPTKLRNMFTLFHRVTAASIVILSTLVLFWGVCLFHNDVMVFMLVTLALYVVVNICFLVFLEVLKIYHNFSSLPPVGYHKVTHRDDLTDSEEETVFVKEQTAKYKGNYSLERGLLLLFAIVNLIFAGIIGMLIFYYDAQP